VNVGRTPLLRRPRPRVVNSNAAQSVIIFEDIGANSVFMPEFGPRIRSKTTIDLLRVAKPISKRIEMMDRHDSERHPTQLRLPGHPMRNAPHLNRGQNWFPQSAVFQERFPGAD